MSKIKVRVFDDVQFLGKGYADQIRSVKRTSTNLDVDTIDRDQFRQAMEELENRRKHARGKPTARERCIVDEFDVFIIDYDLLDLPDAASFLTAENVAYLARCYSSCKIIVILNQFGKNTFDLTLRGPPESFADLNLGSKHLECPGLWGIAGEPGDFRPWVWPVLPQAVSAFQRRVELLKGNLKEPILSFLGMTSVAESLPRNVVEFLSGPKDPAKVTFGEFVMKSGNGLRPKDKCASDNDEQMARIAAARVAKWLERLVLPGQDILVDAPHLVSRYPSLLKGGRKNVKRWNRTASFASLNKLGIDHAKIEDSRFQKTGWISRPAWFWRDVSKSTDIDEVKDPWNAEQPEWVFCEDTSTFEPPDKCRQFVADLPSPFVQRFVRKVANVEYTPSVRFSL